MATCGRETHTTLAAAGDSSRQWRQGGRPWRGRGQRGTLRPFESTGRTCSRPVRTASHGVDSSSSSIDSRTEAWARVRPPRGGLHSPAKESARLARSPLAPRIGALLLLAPSFEIDRQAKLRRGGAPLGWPIGAGRRAWQIHHPPRWRSLLCARSAVQSLRTGRGSVQRSRGGHDDAARRRLLRVGYCRMHDARHAGGGPGGGGGGGGGGSGGQNSTVRSGHAPLRGDGARPTEAQGWTHGEGMPHRTRGA